MILSYLEPLINRDFTQKSPIVFGMFSSSAKQQKVGFFMIQLRSVFKTYPMQDISQNALHGIDLSFREAEFAAILGQSGSGKTTLLNLIGGLDHCTSGDILLNGISTRRFTEHDWDIYRSQWVGFVSQSYNLIPHQTVFENVRLALAFSGPVQDPDQKALAVLRKVGLQDQLHKKPGQLSGGQMQRVAIARALVNDPKIILADEPTGALDTQTSIQIMELLKEIAADRLVILVTHNTTLAERYATRIIRLVDGGVVQDTDPYEEPLSTASAPLPTSRRSALSAFRTAFSLSFSNLKNKAVRFLLTAIGGSIGIIGIALILSLAQGSQNYLTQMQQDMTALYPITIQSSVQDLGGLGEALQILSNQPETTTANTETDTTAGEGFSSSLADFKTYLESADGATIRDNARAIQYCYDLPLSVYAVRSDDSYLQIYPLNSTQQNSNSLNAAAQTLVQSMGLSDSLWQELPGEEAFLKEQYTLVSGQWPTGPNEIVLVINSDNQIHAQVLYMLGCMGRDALERNNDFIALSEDDYSGLLGREYALLPNTSCYEKVDDLWEDQHQNLSYLWQQLNRSYRVHIAGIVKPTHQGNASLTKGFLGYSPSLTQTVLQTIKDSPIAQEQLAEPSINVFTGQNFVSYANYTEDELIATLPVPQQLQLSALSSSERTSFLENYRMLFSATYASNLAEIGIVDLDRPASINIYLTSLQARETLFSAIDTYNQAHRDSASAENPIASTDVLELVTGSVTNIVNLITNALLVIVSVSLLVSSLMIGIISYISVLERTHEIGILRSIGASRWNIFCTFCAESMIIGLTSGLLGVGTSAGLLVPLNHLLQQYIHFADFARMSAASSSALILLSILLSVLAGTFPAAIASRKDPAVVLRSIQ